MKLSVCVQTDDVEKQAPVALFTGSLGQRAAKAAAAGAHGLELMTVDPKSLDAGQVRGALLRNGLAVSAIGSGAIAFATGLTLLHPDDVAAARARALLDELIDFAAAVEAPLVTIGSFRGKVAGRGEHAREMLAETLLASWEGAFRRAGEAGLLWHVHIGDNNRLPPGRGMIDFRRVIAALAAAGYRGYLSAELLARPDGDAAGRESLAHLRPLLEGYL